MIDEEQLEALAEDLVAEAMAELDGTLSEREQKELRELMIAELLGTPGGLRVLRQVAPDPVVQSSAEVERGGGSSEGEPGSAAREPAPTGTGGGRGGASR